LEQIRNNYVYIKGYDLQDTNGDDLYLWSFAEGETKALPASASTTLGDEYYWFINYLELEEDIY